jgi:hypothetical protein
MLNTIAKTLKELFQIFLLWEVVTATMRVVVFRRIRGRHTLEKAIFRGTRKLLRYSIKTSKKLILKLNEKMLQKRQEQLTDKAAPDNIIPFRKRA